MTTVIFQDRGFDYAVRFRFDPTVVDLLKTAVPSYARSWNPSERMWTVDADWARPLAGILRSAGHTVTGLQPPKPPPTRNGHGDADWAKTLFRRVGPGRTDIVYRMLSKALHPDVGGDTRLMQELNDARNEIDEKGHH